METDFKKILLDKKKAFQQYIDAINLLLDAEDNGIKTDSSYNWEVRSFSLSDTEGVKNHPISKKITIKRPDKYKTGYKPFYDALENISLTYSPKLKHVEKAVFALFNLKSGDKFELANYIANHDPGIDKKYLAGVFGNILSKMYNEHLVDAEKRANRNVYKWKLE